MRFAEDAKTELLGEIRTRSAGGTSSPAYGSSNSRSARETEGRRIDPRATSPTGRLVRSLRGRLALVAGRDKPLTGTR